MRIWIAIFISGLMSCEALAGGFSSFELQSAASYAYGRSKAPDGSNAERFELRAGDCTTSNGDCRDDRERVERSENLPASTLGREYWYHFSVFIPKDWPQTGPLNTKLGQFHQKGFGKGPVLFQILNGQYIFELSNPAVRQASPMAPLKPLRQVALVSASSMKGRWTDVTVNAKWSQSSDGFIKVWVNGAQKVNLHGPNIDRNTAVYFKYGIYRSFVSRAKGKPLPTLVAWYRDINRGSSRESVEK
ncbi:MULTISPECIES: polysaccharide lyase [unclassified Rhizobium]|uniref:polysaccharide lyase n=1 Tax=unclassified Rhizobium TaxID=2613769 RepID=UPI0007F0A049|nr:MULTISPECIES: polysaccharide lyase [unclassified Rhizobium]ANL10282.1 polysaccharide lyase family protein [Rhizobium sp. N1341]ANM41126.1 polysaccharide lyase family protein [Rhizobium sp. N741]